MKTDRSGPQRRATDKSHHSWLEVSFPPMSLYKITALGSAWGPTPSCRKPRFGDLKWPPKALTQRGRAGVTNLAGLPGAEGLAGMRNSRAEAGTVPGKPGLEAGDPGFPQPLYPCDRGEETAPG